MLRLYFFIPLWLMYLVLTADLSFSNLLIGLLIAAAVTSLVHPGRRPLDLKRLPSALLAVAQYIGILAVDIILNGLQVARILLTPKMPINPGIIAIPSLCESEMGTALSAHAITVSPGELVVEIGKGGIMYTHTLNIEDSQQQSEAAQRLRVNLLQRIFP
jgi:multicomponent Na+:H+ antiporter subunit E